MTQLTVTDLENAKKDVDTLLQELQNSTANTVTTEMVKQDALFTRYRTNILMQDKSSSSSKRSKCSHKIAATALAITINSAYVDFTKQANGTPLSD